MSKLILAQNDKQTMSHIDISKLVDSRPDSVKRTIERLTKNGTITFTPTVESNAQNKDVVLYNVNERDSYIVVAQLSPEFTAFLVDEWQKRKQPAEPSWLISLSPEAKIAIADLSKQRDEALATKAQINDKRTATIMGRLGNEVKKVKKLEAMLEDKLTHISQMAAGLPDRIDTEYRNNVQTWRVLKQISEKMSLSIIKIKDARYGDVNGYHVDVIEAFENEYL